ncbi:TPA: YbaK/EbsC family protein [Aeromonas salmonicida]|nr:YbaK/EbsC family protein [Aeromonas salmonicida]HEH9421716.1 YbaK/EbsC family protein [Aeromonas salmonicida]HEH9434775.1 YbaK/EbsC family protein [Aeromonas salmonicida]
MPLDTIHDFNCQLLAPLPHQRYQHEPILDYATDERVRARFGWQAVFSKTLFLKFKDGRFALLLTNQEGRLDNKAVKAALGAKPSICTAEEMQAEIGCLPGAVCPFLPRADIPLLVDSALLAHDAFTWTPGHPEQTFILATEHLPRVLAQLPCQVSYLTTTQA